MSDLYGFEATNNRGETVSLADYQGKVLLIVNTASACGFTPQYEGLENLYKTYAAQGFEVLAFPCNQFGGQEQGSDAEIAQFCDLNFHISFPLFSKIEVNGDNTAPLFAYLKKNAKGLLGSERIKWNFTKFLVNRQGKVIKRFATATKPEQMTSAIEAALAE
ncbi:glutathione peroxidase [Corallincola holothuriorum]|uniref:Glutathione peroxidase n=1 Tax=Corallincola holothuriorum TaxID=2282215 RepID=A0A368NND7_9GAMM|nr:glutathione peroxidase [Corallincola holothuriorum]RCU50821.1 glutathione peroxidase [Corallincola holothuriorum]